MEDESPGCDTNKNDDKTLKYKYWTHTKRKLGPDAEIFEEGNIICNLATKQLPLEAENYKEENKTRLNNVCCGVAGCRKVLDSLSSYELHYSSVHRNVCHNCRRNFPSAHLLDIHILEWHDSMFELLSAKQPMFQCLVESCDIKFSNRKSRKNHMIKVHKYPGNFRFDRPGKQREHSDNGMETDTPLVPPQVLKDNTTNNGQRSSRKFSYKVPDNICFGQGSVRGFVRGKGKRGRGTKHWHNREGMGNTAVDIESVDMQDLANALDST